MRIEWWLLAGVYAAATGILFFIPKNKFRLAVVAFLFTQIITFLVGLVVVQLGLLKYPVRLFASINRTSFTYEHYAFPIACAAFNIWYPNKRSTFLQFGYYVGCSSVLTIAEVIIEKYTYLIKYIHWHWYITWMAVCLSFYLARLFCGWFFSKD
ncbi:CBO0543 family protein [Neobacillus sp. Marseille-QA0830]